MKTRALFAAVIAMTMIACDEDTNPMLDSGPGIDSGPTPGTDSGPTPGTDSGPTPDGGGNEDAGGTPGGGCEAYAEAFCEQLMTCDAEIFLGRYETMAICLEVTEERCAGTGDDAIEDVPPLEDPAACAAAQTGSCAAVIGGAGPLVEACIPPPGPREAFAACSNDYQCGIGERFDGVDVRMGCIGPADALACGEGTCEPMQPEGNACTPGSTRCDYFLGLQCLRAFQDDAAEPLTGGNSCREVSYNTSGGECYPGSDQQCALGFVCDTTSRRCMAPLGRGAVCATDNPLCDSTLLLTCVDDDINPLTTAGHCEGPDYAPIGARCGTFTEGSDEVTRLCSAYAFCNEDSPTECEARDRVTEPCSSDPAPGVADSCWPGYECRSSTCMPPEPPSSC